MYTPDRQINPPDFYEKDEVTEQQLLDQIAEIEKKQDDKLNFMATFFNVWHKAKERIEWIKRSKAIPYEVAGGYFARQQDLLKAEKAFNWIEQTITRLENEVSAMEQDVEYLQRELKRL